MSYEHVIYQKKDVTSATKLLLTPVSYEHVIYQKKDGIANLIINRPEVMNSMDHQTIQELLSALADAEADDDVRVVILSGAGEKAFCAGDDVKAKTVGELWHNWLPGKKAFVLRREHYYHLIDTIRSLFKPVIASVSGWCVGGGLGLALACDVIIASETAKFRSPFVSLGIVNQTAFIPRIIGYHKACEFLFTGDLIDAREAERIGLVNHVVPQEQLQSKVRELAEKIAKQPTPVVSWTKWALNKAMGDYYKEALDYEAVACAMYHPSKYIPSLLERQKRGRYSQKKK